MVVVAAAGVPAVHHPLSPSSIITASIAAMRLANK
jgi:hypothetical protein